MNYIFRNLQETIQETLARGKSVLLLGPRQTGKTTLIKHLETDYQISFIQPIIRLRYERQPSILTAEIEGLAKQISKKPLVVVDEVQKVPEILDVAQDLIDRNIAQFILTGSSARKLKQPGRINLLPGRVVALRLDPLMLNELPAPYISNINNLLLYGSLPGILATLNERDKEIDLISYVSTYLEEEIRAEAVVRNVASFSRFLALAASESGNIVNLTKLSQEIGVAHTTIAAYYQILEDCLIAERIEPLYYTKTRRKLIKSAKYLFFDLGVRRIAANEGILLPESYLGRIFEQFIGLELIRCTRLLQHRAKVYFWRDSNGPEVDWVIECNNHYYPIEVKWSEAPSVQDVKHLQLFIKEHSNVTGGIIVCRTPRRLQLTANIIALPWQELNEYILSL